MSKKAMCRRSRYLFGDARTDLISTFFENKIYDMIGFPNVLMKARIFDAEDTREIFFITFQGLSAASAQMFRAALYERPAAELFST